jgi:geranylgeranyl diphosphate synthase, type II
MNFEGYLQSRKFMVDEALERWIPGENEFSPQVHEAIHYSLFAGGTRLRPILAPASAETVGGQISDAQSLWLSSTEVPIP